MTSHYIALLKECELSVVPRYKHGTPIAGWRGSFRNTRAPNDGLRLRRSISIKPD